MGDLSGTFSGRVLRVICYLVFKPVPEALQGYGMSYRLVISDIDDMNVVVRVVNTGDVILKIPEVPCPSYLQTPS